MESKDFLRKFGQKVRTTRNEKNMSMQELADYCNIDKSTIYRIEKGLMNPTITVVQNICENLEIKVNDLIE